MSEFSDKSTKRTKPNYIYSIISVALVLFLLGFFGLIILHAQRLMIVFKEKVNILAELKESSPQSDIETFQLALNNYEFVKDGSVNFISKEEAVELMQEEFGEDFLKLDLPNPFFDVITFNVKAVYLEKDSLQNIREELLSYDAVNDVFYQESLTNNIGKNIRKLGFLALGISLFFILVAVTLIHNTIRLALYSNRFLIKNMELVGASWEFISRPYIMKAILQGVISSLIALAALGLIMYWVWQDIPEIRELKDIPGYIALGVFLIAIGILINTLSTYLVVNKYLKMQVDDLY
jgi:cell division transport system permease protein